MLVNVVADLPIPSQQENIDEFYTGGELVFNGPFSPDNGSSDAIDDGWSVCLYKWLMCGAAYPASLRADDGTCSSVLSSECTRPWSLDEGDGQGQDGDDSQDGQQDGGGRINANWLVLGSLLVTAMLVV